MNLGAAMTLGSAVKHFIEMRREPRIELDPASNSAVLVWRGRSDVVHLSNISPSGAMFLFDGEVMPNKGERVEMQMADRKKKPAQVMWVREGKVGLSFENHIR